MARQITFGSTSAAEAGSASRLYEGAAQQAYKAGRRLNEVLVYSGADLYKAGFLHNAYGCVVVGKDFREYFRRARLKGNFGQELERGSGCALPACN